MICPHCQTENPEDARFCANCGHSLRRVCPNCATEHPLSANFCSSCGERLPAADLSRPAAADLSRPAAAASSRLTAAGASRLPAADLSRPAAQEAPASTAEQQLVKYIPKELLGKLESARAGQTMAGERRVVTILFCDVKGSTAAAERMDPEDWAEIMNGAFEHLIAPVYRYEGTLARLMGDAVLAFFGAPIGHEDDAERAVLAGLGIVQGIGPYREQVRQQWELDFDVRVGINTGLVVVGEVGSDLRVEYTAMGDAVNLAARMEQTAQPGSVQVAEETYRRVAPLFEFEALGPIEVKGKSEPVKAYRAVRRKPQPGRLRGIPGLHAPLVGRSQEMGELRGAVDKLLGGGGGIVGLIGEAGLGKSRMIGELRSELGAQPHYWAESRGISYEASRPYGQFHQQLRLLCGIGEGDRQEEQQRKLEKLVASLPAEQQASAAQVLQAFFETRPDSGAAALEGERFKQEFFQANLAIWRWQAEKEPTVLVLDDLHWADSASVELLVHLFQLTDWTPLLLLCAFRPDRSTPAWQVKQAAEAEYPHRYREIALAPLSDEGSRELVDQLLAISELPPNLHELIQRRAEGNPFFVEEVIRDLIDKGLVVRDTQGTRWRAGAEIDELDIPDSLKALLNARIDRLDGSIRRTLQLASVIGRTFYYRVLQAIAEAAGELDRHLSVLQRVELILEAAREPDLEYAFRHALTQEAAYRSILRKERRLFHQRVGETLERLFPEHTEEMAPVLAHHYLEAGDGRGARYAVVAADAAYRMYAVREAIRLYRQALQAADPADLDSRRHIYTRLGRSLELADQFGEALQVYDQMRAMAAEAAAGEVELTALTESAKVHSIPSPMFDPDKARWFSDQALQVAERLQNPEVEARILWNRMNAEVYLGDLERAAEFGQRSLQVAERYELREQLAFTLNDLARTVLMVGEPERAAEYVQRSRELWRELENLPMLADNYAGGSMTAFWTGDFERALEEAAESYRIAGSISNPWGQASSRVWAGLVHLEQGKFDSAIEILSDGLQLGEQAGAPLAAIFSGAFLGLAYAAVGDLQAAASALDRAASVDQTHLTTQFPIALAVRARLLLWDGRLADARQAYEASSRDYNPLLVNIADYVHLAEAEIALAEGRPDRAVAACDELLELDERVGRRPAQPEALLLKARGLRMQRELDRGRQALMQAGQAADRLGAARLRWQILLEHSRLEAEAGDLAAAERLRAEAASQVGDLRDAIAAAELRRSFESLPEVRAALEN